MAKTSKIISQQKKSKYKVRAYNRCKICGRPHSYMRKFGICRVCFRKSASNGELPGIKKSSW